MRRMSMLAGIVLLLIGLSARAAEHKHIQEAYALLKGLKLEDQRSETK